MEHFEKRQQLTCGIIIFCLAALALLVRAPGLGKWCLAVDEYYISRSVSFILEKGVPEFPGGGYYDRGIALQYLTAGASLLFKNREFASRIVPLVFGVLSIPLFFIFCRLFLPLLPALFCAVILLLSSWHIEFSRFARMYAPFQFVFFAFLYCFYIGYFNGSSKHRRLSWLLAFIAIFIYEGSVFLPLILSLPLIDEDVQIDESRTRMLLGIFVLIVLNLLAHKVSYKDIGIAVSNIPLELKNTPAGIRAKFPVNLPGLELFGALLKSKTASISYLFISGGFLLFFRETIFRKKTVWTLLITIAAIALPFFHQFGLLISILIILFLLRSDIKNSFFNEWRFWLPYLFSLILIWVVFGFVGKSSYLSGDSGNHLFKELAKSLFLYPPYHADVLFPFSRSIPIWSGIVFFLISVSLTRAIFFQRKSSSRFLLMIIVLFSFVISLLKKPYHDTRYFFFFFPLIIIIAYLEIGDLKNWLLERLGEGKRVFITGMAVMLPFVLFLTTEDFNFRHVLEVSSPMMNFRMGKYDQFSVHWYPRADFRSPAEYVNTIYTEGDEIVIDYSPISYYIDKPFVNFISPKLKRFRGQARNEGRDEMWTGRPLIYDIATLMEAVPPDRERKMWIVSIVDDFGGGSFMDENYPLNLARRYGVSATLEFVGIDGRIGVWRIQRKETTKRSISDIKG